MRLLKIQTVKEAGERQACDLIGWREPGARTHFAATDVEAALVN